jgi:hypothetical protein
MAEVAASEGMGTLPMGVIQSCEPATGAGYWGCLGDFFN